MKTAVIGFPRVGKNRELKYASEKYWKKEISEVELLSVGESLRKEHWKAQKGIDYISSNDFSFYDNVLDTCELLNIIPKRYTDLNLSKLDTYFAMARGYQGDHGDVKALTMKKWYNTNYHYLVPEIEEDTEIKLLGRKIFDEFLEAKNLGVLTKPTIIGPYSLLKLTRFTGSKKIEDIKEELIEAYNSILKELKELGAE